MRQLVWLGGRFCTAVAVFSMGLVVPLLLAAAPALGETEEPAADANNTYNWGNPPAATDCRWD